MKILKLNNNTCCNLTHIVRNCFVFIGILMWLMVFPAIADEDTNAENTDESVVEQVEEEETVEPDNSEDEKNTDEKEETKTENENTPADVKKEVITGTSDESDMDIKTGITILLGNVKTLRHDEDGKVIGFLNADKITIKRDLDTGETKEIIAVGNVEIRDQDIFATCDHAVMDNLTNIITLKDNVEVLQNNDRLETKLFTYNRTTGRQTGVGDVKFKVTITQPVPEEGSEEEEGSEDEDKEEDKGKDGSGEEDEGKNGSKEEDKEGSKEDDGGKDGSGEEDKEEDKGKDGSDEDDASNEEDKGKDGSEEGEGSDAGDESEEGTDEDDEGKNGSEEEDGKKDGSGEGDKEGSDEEDKDESDEGDGSEQEDKEEDGSE